MKRQFWRVQVKGGAGWQTVALRRSRTMAASEGYRRFDTPGPRGGKQHVRIVTPERFVLSLSERGISLIHSSKV